MIRERIRKHADEFRSTAHRHLRSLNAWAAHRENRRMTALTESSRVEALLRSLHPIEPGRPLIRLGPDGDGGYLVPDDLVGVEACFSPGVGKISGFERDCADRGMKVFMADASVDAPVDVHENFSFVKKYIAATDNGGYLTLDTWVRNSLSDRGTDLLLQIDIEGGEYEVFLNTSDELMSRFRVIVAEFHELDALFSEPFFSFASRTFEKILQTHCCVHIHPNNYYPPVTVDGIEIPPIAEFTFARRDRIDGETFAHRFPHPLDFDNTDHPHVRLPGSLFRST